MSGTLRIWVFGTQHHAQGERPKGRSHMEVLQDFGSSGTLVSKVKAHKKERRHSASKCRSVEFLYNWYVRKGLSPPLV
jgi:hypothetical protein